MSTSEYIDFAAKKLMQMPPLNKVINYRSEDMAVVIISIVVVIVSALVFWIFFYRREKSETAKSRKVLQRVFNANNGNMWENKYRNHWQSEAPISQWSGVETHDFGGGDVVTAISMRENINFNGAR
jgi:hypothetical protein